MILATQPTACMCTRSAAERELSWSSTFGGYVAVNGKQHLPNRIDPEEGPSQG